MAVATTDRNGDASFMAITETPGSVYNYETGKIENTNWTNDAPINLYSQNITTELMNNGINIDQRIYQDNLHQNMNYWIGRPLILGRYYVKELSRSEGYELSVTGINKTFTNNGVVDDIAFESTGSVRYNGYKADEQYGDSQDDNLRFDVLYQDVSGYDIEISGYPAGTKFYHETEKTEIIEEETVIGTHTEITNTPILAKGGEFVIDENGSKVLLLDSNGNQVYDTTPLTGNFYPVNRNGNYPNGSATISDVTKYNSSNIDLSFIKTEGQSILKQIGYLGSSNTDAMPWKTITVSGHTNGEIIENLINELREDSFFDSYTIDKITRTGENYEIIVRYAYVYRNAKAYLNNDGTLYVKNSCTNILENGNSVAGYYYVKYSPDEYAANGNAYTIEIKKLDGDAVYGNEYVLVNDYAPLYKTYSEGEQKYGLMIQDDGTYEYGPLFETITVEEKGMISSEVKTYELTELDAAYQNGIYTLHIDTSDIDWSVENIKTDSFRAVLPNENDKTTVKQTSTITASPQLEEMEAGTYVKYKILTYNSQHDVFSGDETRINPIKVMERPIRQQVKVIKNIQTNPDGSYVDDTYSAVHKENLSADGYNRWYTKAADWLTNLINGDSGKESTEKIDNFRFKAYLKSNLERLYRDENGNVIWLDRNGNVLTPNYIDTNGDGNYDTFNWTRTAQDGSGDSIIDFPEKQLVKDESLQSSNVQKIYTKVEHNTSSTTTGDNSNNTWATYNDPQTGETKNVGQFVGFTTSQDGTNGEAIRANASLYSYDGNNFNVKKTDRINEGQNTGYTRLLEMTTSKVEDGAGKTREIQTYNYKKFFDAINAANTDKWDDDMHSSDKNYPGQNWFETFYEKYQKDDADADHTIENTDGVDKDNTAGGDRDTSYKPFQWIRENIFKENGEEKDYYNGTANNPNIENTINTSTFAHENAEASDAVRQFAIDYYLQDEVGKLVQNNGQDEDEAIPIDGKMPTYADEVYDRALHNALIKAVNYLKPFYDNDLDTLYSVEWDTEVNGGADNDYTTLNIAKTDADKGYYYGISSYLPYGTYVVVEQQPQRIDGTINDFTNKNYKTDLPKEVILPSLYNGDKSNDTFDNFDANYLYDTTKTPETLAKDYYIRFNEEWSDVAPGDLRNYVIRAHNYDGDYEIYKYGLDIDKLTAKITYGDKSYDYDGFTVTQETSDPLKDYYNPIHKVNEKNVTIAEGANDNSHYFADDGNDDIETANGSHYAKDSIEERYHYGSISEHSGEINGFRTMTGIQTAYEGRYASMIVPWTVVTPVDLDSYKADDFAGFADIGFHNTFYKVKLKIEKLDSETGDNILHDGAVFGLYAASRYTTQDEVDEAITNGAPETTKIGDAKFYLKDTTITGTYEFLKAMGADDIKPYEKIFNKNTNLYSGTVPAGTPVCVESEQIILYDDTGAKTGDMTVYTTTNDVNMVAEEDESKAYHDQNTGYFVTPQPIGAGVYVLAELKPPTGYSRTKPIAIEVYSDAVTYYFNGDMNSQVEATIYKD